MALAVASGSCSEINMQMAMMIRALVALLTCLGTYVDSGSSFCGRQYC